MSNKEIWTEITAMIFCLVMAVAIGFVVGSEDARRDCAEVSTGGLRNG